MNIAHNDKDNGTQQSIREHSLNTAELCKQYAISPFKNFMYTVGLLHDIGKFQPSFQKRILGNNSIKVEHSICGAQEIPQIMCFESGILKLVAQLCIAGHHSGIPDVGCCNDTHEDSTLKGRLKRKTEDFSRYKSELEAELSRRIDEQEEKIILDFLCKDCNNNEEFINKFTFFVRYCFSCLTDADSMDTAEFFGEKINAPLTANFEECLAKTNKKLSTFECKTKLQKTRTSIQNQVFEKTDEDSEIYLINMPTGSGKTLCSLKFALERAIKKKKNRIIYVIPYNSIINQIAEEFEELLGEAAQILRHQSTFDYEDLSNINNNEDYKKACEFAVENWDSQFIITTAVQFFESLHKNSRKRLRKLHNMSNSILIFDEAHLMPTEYLKPCLDAICYLAKYLNSEAVFLTATMPDYRKLIEEHSLKNCQILNLVDDTSEFEVFKKCSFRYIGEINCENLIKQAKDSPSYLIIANTKVTARKIFGLLPSDHKKYHLSTYMTSKDREDTINKIKDELNKLEEDFPNLENIPENRKIAVVSTSLIEAGVDLDFYKVFREFNGLDHILQAGGRCNREGKRTGAEVDIFELEEGKYTNGSHFAETKANIEKYQDISCKDSINDYYRRLHSAKNAEIQRNSLHKFCSDPYKIRLKEYAKKFNLIEDVTISIIIDQDEESQKLINELKNTKKTNMRKLQKYACIVYRKEFNELQKQGAVDDYGTGVWCLTNEDYYDSETGIKTEACDYII